MHSYIDITNRIERLEVFEERLGVTLKSLSAFFSDFTSTGKSNFVINICGELHAINGTNINQSINVIFDVYDTCGRIIKIGMSSYFNAKIFFGIESFKVELQYLPVSNISKIRIYPRSSGR